MCSRVKLSYLKNLTRNRTCICKYKTTAYRFCKLLWNNDSVPCHLGINSLFITNSQQRPSQSAHQKDLHDTLFSKFLRLTAGVPSWCLQRAECSWLASYQQAAAARGPDNLASIPEFPGTSIGYSRRSEGMKLGVD